MTQLKKHKRAPWLIAALLALPVMATASSTAEARTYRYQGTCYDFHGEALLIEALDFMDQAALADCDSDRVRATWLAHSRVKRALYEVCSYHAKHELREALDDLDDYLRSAAVCDLDSAADRILAALDRERRQHVGRDQLYGAPAAPARSYCFTGQRCGFGGEDYLIDALQHMDHAYSAGQFRGRVEHVSHARQAILRGHRQMDCPGARREVLRALGPLAVYQSRGDVAQLDKASHYIHAAIALETKQFQSRDRYEDRYRSGFGRGHGSDYGFGYDGQRSWTRDPQSYRGGYRQAASGITFGGRNWQVTIPIR